MPCYDGCREDERRDRETAKKVEAVLCAVIRAFTFEKVIMGTDFSECGVNSGWFAGWWREHERKDAARNAADAETKERARKQAILDSGDYMVLHQMLEKPIDIHATVLALQKAVPAGCETIAPPEPTASGVRTTYYGDVRLVRRRSIPSRASWSGAPISISGRNNYETYRILRVHGPGVLPTAPT